MSEMAIYRQRPFTCLTVQGFSPMAWSWQPGRWG